MVLKGKELEKTYKDKYPTGLRTSVDLASFNLIFSEFGRNGLLDVGCGFGEMISALTPFNFECYGMTITQYEVDACIKKGLNVVKADASKKFPFDSGSFDSIIMLDSIEHFENYEMSLSESYRLLRKGGKILIQTPNEHIFRKSEKYVKEADFVHVKEFTLIELRQALENVSFKNVRFINKKFYYPKYYWLRFLNPIIPKSGLVYICAVAEK